MAEHSIVELLAGREQWEPNEDPSDEFPTAVATAWGVTLPRDYWAVLRSNGGYLDGETPMYFDRAAQLSRGWNTDHAMPAIPSAIVFGHDGGGSFFFFDTDGSLGNGSWSVFLVRMADKDAASSIFVGSTITEVVHAVLSGEDLFDREDLGG